MTDVLATIAVRPDDPAVADWLRERGWTVGRGPGHIAQLRKYLFVGSPRSDELAVLTSAATRKLRALTLEIDGGHPDDILRNPPSELRALSLWAHGGLYPGTTLIPWARVPHLARLEVFSGGFLFPIAAPELEELLLKGSWIHMTFPKAELPRLRVLHIWLRDPPTNEELSTLIARLPALRHLAIHGPVIDQIDPPATLELLELVDQTAGPGRRRFKVDRTPPTPRAALLSVGGRLIELDAQEPNALEVATIEWRGREWWLSETSATLNRTFCKDVGLRDGDELVAHASTWRFIAAPTDSELSRKVSAMRSRYGLES